MLVHSWWVLWVRVHTTRQRPLPMSIPVQVGFRVQSQHCAAQMFAATVHGTSHTYLDIACEVYKSENAVGYAGLMQAYVAIEAG